MSDRNTLEKLLKWAHAAMYVEQHGGEHVPADRAPGPFITISRQAGARGHTFARLLAQRLNALDPADHPWTVWDRELVERVAAEHGIPAAAVESVERRRRWWEELSANWSDREHAAYLGESQVYRRVASTIHALASAARAIIVGRGGVYATADLPRGLHLRLVAPFDARVAHMARELNVSPDAAAKEVRRRDDDRETFHRRYFPGRAMLPEVFTLTLNAAVLTDEQMASCILPLVATNSPAPADRADATDAERPAVQSPDVGRPS